MTNTKRYYTEVRGYTAEVIDRETDRIVAHADIPECREVATLLNKGMTIDEAIAEVNRYLLEHLKVGRGPAPVIDMPVDRYVIEPY